VLASRQALENQQYLIDGREESYRKSIGASYGASNYSAPAYALQMQDVIEVSRQT
jgi:hypothetical protein